MSASDFQALRQTTRQSVIARILGGATASLGAARQSSRVARQVERVVTHARSMSPGERLRGCLQMLAIAAVTHVVLVLPAPSPARSALPLAVPLVLAAVMLGARSAIRPDRRR